MELILIRDVPALGIANEVVKVKEGYARNYLLPRHLAVPATPAALKERAGKIEKAQARKKERTVQSQELADRIGRISVEFTRKASEEGRLFGSVTKEDIADQLKEKHLIEIDRRLINLAVPLKTIGDTQVRIRLESGVSASLMVKIAGEAKEEIKTEAKAEAKS